MGKITADYVRLTVIMHVYAAAVSVTARVLPLHPYYDDAQIYDTSKYGILQLGNGLAQTPQMGWNSWNFFRCDIDEKVIRETADALVTTGLAKLGYVYVNLDDCWSELARDSEGDMVPDSIAFPSGIKALADYMHSKGLKIGIYSDAGYGKFWDAFHDNPSFKLYNKAFFLFKSFISFLLLPAYGIGHLRTLYMSS